MCGQLEVSQKVPPPLIVNAAGKAWTVTVVDTEQPVDKVYVTTVVPGKTPVILPPVVIVAFGGVQLKLPPEGGHDNE